jgi:hypothetical protein
LSARAAELAELRERLNAERNKLQETQSQMTDVSQALLLERSNLAQLKEEQKRRKFEIMTEARTPPLEFDCVQDRTAASRGVDDVPLELTRHNKVFRTERAGCTLLVTPLGLAAIPLQRRPNGSEQSPSTARSRILFEPRG